jgi:iron complex outermembrane receptor protein
VFGETTFSLTEKWKILLGARWYDTQIDRTATRNIPATGPLIVVNPSGSDDGVLPKIGFQYFFEEERMIYALYSEGFRTGGINRARGNPTLPIEYKSDLLNNYEGGLKSRWLGGRMQFNVDLSLLATDHWSLGVVATYLFKNEIDNDIVVFDDRSPDDVVLNVPAGTQLPLASDTNVAAYSEFNWPVDWMSGGNVFLRLQYAYTGESYNRLVDSDLDDEGTGYAGRVKQPSYALWDMRGGFSNELWEFTAYIDNMTDERAVVYHDTNADLFWGRDNIRTLRPRTFGFNLRRYFR